MRYLSVCSGIEAASAAWQPLGWTPVALSEIEPFPCSALAHHHPAVPNWGDMTKFEEWPDEPIDLLCGGTPCQSFSVAGLRKGLADPRGNLMLTFGAIAAKYRPRWLVWENVPGVLSSNSGRDFGSFLGLLGELGYGFAYRVLDAQYVRVESHPRAVPQRRRRVFVVGHSGGLWQRAAAVLFERASLCGHPAPRREARESVAGTLSARTKGGGGLGTDFDLAGGVVRVCPTLRAGGNRTGGDRPPGTDADTADSLIVQTTHTLRGEGFDASEDGTGRGTPIVPVSVALRGREGGATAEIGDDVAFTLRASAGGGDKPHVIAPVAFDTTQITSKANRSSPKPGDPCHPLAGGAHAPCIAFPERLSGTQCVRSENVSPALGALNPTAIAIQERADAAPNSGPGGKGWRDDGAAYTLEARHRVQAIATQWAVRRLTPLECERLMGFPDGHTSVPHKGKPATDGPRYKALGNSWAVNCARWIGERIEAVDAIVTQTGPEKSQQPAPVARSEERSDLRQPVSRRSG